MNLSEQANSIQLQDFHQVTDLKFCDTKASHVVNFFIEAPMS